MQRGTSFRTLPDPIGLSTKKKKRSGIRWLRLLNSSVEEDSSQPRRAGGADFRTGFPKGSNPLKPDRHAACPGSTGGHSLLRDGRVRPASTDSEPVHLRPENAGEFMGKARGLFTPGPGESSMSVVQATVRPEDPRGLQCPTPVMMPAGESECLDSESQANGGREAWTGRRRASARRARRPVARRAAQAADRIVRTTHAGVSASTASISLRRRK